MRRAVTATGVGAMARHRRARVAVHLVVVLMTMASLFLCRSTDARAQSVWYWYYSPSSGGGCWNTVSSPTKGSAAYQCDDPGANYLPSSTIAGQTVHTYIQNGAFDDVRSVAAHSGDYCNSYDMAAFTSYLDSDPYYFGNPTSRSYCYADGSEWGQNVNDSAANAAGAQHFASVQGTAAFPWSFGSAPSLYIYSTFGDSTNTSSSAWGYLCADLIDTAGASNELEICGDEWDWNRQQPNLVGCGNLDGVQLAMPEDYFRATAQRYTTERAGSSDTVTSVTVPARTVFSMEITVQDLTNAISGANSTCGSLYGTSWSDSVSGYRLMGVEDGEELALVNGDINGNEDGLLFGTLYN